MAHAYTAIINGRDVRRFLDIPESLYDRRILITIDPVEASARPVTVYIFITTNGGTSCASRN